MKEFLIDFTDNIICIMTLVSAIAVNAVILVKWFKNRKLDKVHKEQTITLEGDKDENESIFAAVKIKLINNILC